MAFFFLRVQFTALIFKYDSEKAIYFYRMGSSKCMYLEEDNDKVVGLACHQRKGPEKVMLYGLKGVVIT